MGKARIVNPLPSWGVESLEDYHERERAKLLADRERDAAVQAEARKIAALEQARLDAIAERKRLAKEQERLERRRLRERRYAVGLPDGSILTSKRPIATQPGWTDLGRVDKEV